MNIIIDRFKDRFIEYRRMDRLINRLIDLLNIDGWIDWLID